MKTTDITDMTDAVLDVFLSAKAGADFVDCDHLSVKERFQLANALGWEMNARTIAWCSGPSANVARGPTLVSSIDYEGMILDRQDETFQD